MIDRPVRLGILAVLAVATGVLVLVNRPREDAAAPAPALGLGYYVRDARLTGTGDDGQILYRVTTASAEQQLQDGTITMDRVAVDYEPAAQVPWKLSADHGQIPPDRNIIELSGDVVAVTQAIAGAAPATSPLLIRTDYLELDPDAYMAITDRPVAMERARDTLHARGMRAYLKQDRLQFNSEVRARFLP